MFEVGAFLNQQLDVLGVIFEELEVRADGVRDLFERFLNLVGGGS